MDRINYTIKTYNKIARMYEIKYGSLPPEEMTYLNLFYKLTTPLSNKPKILDAGCGTGRDLSYLEKFLNELYGIDLSENMLEIARSKLKTTTLIKGDIRKLPFSDEFFDGILSIATLVHFPQKEKEIIIKEFWRVLKPNGILYISLQNFFYPPRFFRCIRYFRKDGILYDGRYWFFPTKYSMKNLLEKNGFKIYYSPSQILGKRLRFYCFKTKVVK